MKKRLIALALSFLMIVSGIPTTVLAADETFEIGDTYQLSTNTPSQLPTDIPAGTEWTGPENGYTCGKTEHTHSIRNGCYAYVIDPDRCDGTSIFHWSHNTSCYAINTSTCPGGGSTGQGHHSHTAACYQVELTGDCSLEEHTHNETTCPTVYVWTLVESTNTDQYRSWWPVYWDFDNRSSITNESVVTVTAGSGNTIAFSDGEVLSSTSLANAKNGTTGTAGDVLANGFQITVAPGYYLTEYRLVCGNHTGCGIVTTTTSTGHSADSYTSTVYYNPSESNFNHWYNLDGLHNDPDENDGVYQPSVAPESTDNNIYHTASGNTIYPFYLLLKVAQDTKTYSVTYDWGILEDSLTSAVPAGDVNLLRNSSHTVKEPGAGEAEAASLGYVFTGWKVESTGYDDNIYVEPGDTVTVYGGDITLVAQWSTAVSYVYTGTVPENAPDAPASQHYDIGASVTVEDEPTVVGYTFSGWSTNDVTVTDGSFTMPSGSVVFEGSFTKDESQTKTLYYQVDYYLNGQLQADESVTVSKTVWINDPDTLVFGDPADLPVGVTTLNKTFTDYTLHYSDPTDLAHHLTSDEHANDDYIVTASTDPNNPTVLSLYYTGSNADIQLTKDVKDSTGKTLTHTDVVKVGDTLTYTIKVENKGTANLTDVAIVDTHNGAGTISFTNTDSIRYANGTFTIASLPVGETVTITYTYVVDEQDAGKALVNNAVWHNDDEETSDTSEVKVEDWYTLTVEHYADGVLQGSMTKAFPLADGSTYTIEVGGTSTTNTYNAPASITVGTATYAFDAPATTDSLSGTLTADTTVKLYYAKDSIGDKEEDGDDKPDGTPDKYQVTFTYTATEGGKIIDITSEVANVYDAAAFVAANGDTSKLTDDDLAEKGVAVASGSKSQNTDTDVYEFLYWTMARVGHLTHVTNRVTETLESYQLPPKNSETDTTQQAVGGSTYVFTAVYKKIDKPAFTIEKLVNRHEDLPIGTEVEYVIHVKNTGTVTLTNVVITDTLRYAENGSYTTIPNYLANIENLRVSGTDASNYEIGTAQTSVTIKELAPDDTVSISYEYVVQLADAGKTIDNLVKATATHTNGTLTAEDNAVITVAKVYTVTYTDGVTNEVVFTDQVTKNIVYGTTTPAFDGTPTRPGYTFNGWSPSVADTVTADATYTAQWTRNTYTVKYVDGVKDIDVFADETYPGLYYNTDTPIYEVGALTYEANGVTYAFAGWDKDPSGTKVTADITYTAKWESMASGFYVEHYLMQADHTYSTTPNYSHFHSQYPDTTLVHEGDKVPYSGTATLRDDTTVQVHYVHDYAGYTLDTETTSGEAIEIGSESTKNVIKVYYSLVDYTVTYTDGVNGTEVFKDQKTTGLHRGDATPAFDGTPTRSGYTFEGWSPAVEDKVSGNATYTAQWKAIPYTVTYVDGVADYVVFSDASYSPLYYGDGTPVYRLSGTTYTKDGVTYAFAGWDKDPVGTKVTGNATYTAKWADLSTSFTVKHYYQNVDGTYPTAPKYSHVHDEYADGTRVSVGDKVPYSGTATLANGDTIAVHYVHLATGFVVDESKTSTEPLEIDAASENNVIEVYYKRNLYTVTYTDGVNGTEVFKDQKTSDLAYGADTPAFTGSLTRTDYYFTGWNPDVADTVTADVTYVAQWASRSVITVNGKSATVTYNGTEQSVEGYESTISGLPAGYTLENLPTHIATGTDASDTPYTGTLTSNGDIVVKDASGKDVSDRFTVVVNEGTLTVNKRTVTLTSETASKTYDGTPLTASTVTGGDGFVAGEVTDIKATGSITEVGSETNTISYTPVDGKFKATNYEIIEKPGTLTVTAHANEVVVTIVGNTKTVTYDGTEHTVTGYEVTSISDDRYSTDDFAFKGNESVSGTDAGTYNLGLEAEYFINTNPNFTKVTFQVTDGKLTINKRTVVLTSEDASKTYDGTALTKPDVAVTGDGFVAGEATDIKATGTITNAGSETNTISYTTGAKFKAENYTIEKHEGTLTVNKRTVTLTSEGASKEYDGTALTKPDVAVTGDGFVAGEATDIKATGTITDVGSVKNTITYTTGESFNEDNYTIEKIEGTLIVTAHGGIVVTITENSGTYTYDGTEKTVTGYTVTSIKAGDADTTLYTENDFEFTGTDSVSGTNADTYNMELKAEDFVNKNANFKDKVTFVIVDGTLTINKRTVTLTSETASKTYDGTALTKPDVAVTGDGFVAGEVTDIKATGTITNAGSAENTITYTTGEGFNEDNYTIEKVEGKLTVNKRTVTLTSETASKTYDGTPLTKPDVAVTGDGFVDGEVTDIKATGTITNVGSVKNTITYTTGEGFKEDNYTIEKIEGTLTVSAIGTVTVTITENSGTYTYDGTEKTVTGYEITSISDSTYTKDDFRLKEASKDKASVSGIDVGSYDMQLSADDFENINDNFDTVIFVITDGKLTITNADPKITVKYVLKTYDGKTVDVDSATFDGQQANPFTVAYGGSYTVVIGTGTGNYTAPDAITVDAVEYKFDAKASSALTASNVTGDATVTLVYTAETPIIIPVIKDGTLELTKELAAPAGFPGKTQYVFNIYRVSTYNGNKSFVKTVYVKAGETLKLKLEMGTYYIEEEDADVDGYSHRILCDDTDGIIRLSGGATVSMTFTNVYTKLLLELDDHFGYIIGYPDETVRPENNITRAEVATIFFRMLTDEARADYWSTENTFSDVNKEDWFNNAISTLQNAGVLDGYADGTFRPNAYITRAELVKIAVSFYGTVAGRQSHFSDVSAHWAEDFISAAEEIGFVDGYEDNSFQPDKLITRAEAMKIVNRALGRKPHKDGLHKYMIEWVDNMDTSKWYYAEVQEATNSHTYVWENTGFESWTGILPVRDWAALEKTWSEAND